LSSAISSRSANDKYRPESGFAEDLNIAGGMPPAFRNNLGPTASDNPALVAASSLFNPAAIARQNSSCSARPATGGRPSDPNRARVDRFFRMLIATSVSEVLRRPIESASGIPCAMVLTAASRSPWCAGLVSHHRLADHTAKLDSSVGESGPHDLAVRDHIARPAMQSRPPHPAPNTRDDRVVPLLRAQDELMIIRNSEKWKHFLAIRLRGVQ
jgi:MAE_28990/MAE_18760-like HEPN